MDIAELDKSKALAAYLISSVATLLGIVLLVFLEVISETGFLATEKQFLRLVTV